jgi:hypothetical protein
MAITLQNPRGKEPPLGAKGASHTALIKNTIQLGLKHIEVAKKSEFYRELMIDSEVADIIRKCNGTLGLGGNFKNGCLYRQEGLAEKWDKKIDGKVICDHAIPVTALVSQYREKKAPFEHLIFSPVVRITERSNEELTNRGLAKAWKDEWYQYPLSRYAEVGISIVTHKGEKIDTKSWTSANHWELIFDTEELSDVLKGLGMSRDQFLKS